MKFVNALTLAVSISALVFSAAVMAKGDIQAGKEKAKNVCSACHGLSGHAVVATYPNLAGQNEQYIILALKAYRAHNRTGGQAAIMQAQAAVLSDQDIENVAAYFSSLKPCQ